MALHDRAQQTGPEWLSAWSHGLGGELDADKVISQHGIHGSSGGLGKADASSLVRREPLVKRAPMPPTDPGDVTLGTWAHIAGPICKNPSCMPRHYLKISKRLRPYAAKVVSLDDDWRRMIFDDLTNHGRELRIIHVGANEQGPLIGLCGRTFFCHAGQDKHNQHSLFISRIAGLEARPGQEEPTRILGEFELITEADRNPPPRDSVAPLFQQAQAAISSEPAILRPSDPSERLLRALEDCSPELRERFAKVPEPLDDASPLEFLAALKRLWNRYGLERFAEVDPRPLALLKGTIVPKQLSDADCRELAGAFGLPTLNAMVGEPTAEQGVPLPPAQLLELLDELSHLPLDNKVRLEIRRAMMRATSISELDGERSEIVTRWVMNQIGVNSEELQRQLRKASAVTARWMSLGDQVASTADALMFIRHLSELGAEIQTCVEALPSPEQAERSKRDAENAYVRALGSLGELTVVLLESEPGLSASALTEIAGLMDAGEQLMALPPWLWNRPVAPQLPGRRLAWCRALAKPQMRGRIRRAVELVKELDPAICELVSRYPAPPEDEPPEAYFERAVSQLRNIAREFADVPDTHLEWVRHAIDESWSPSRVLTIVQYLEKLGRRLSEQSFGELVADFCSAVRDGDSDSADMRLRHYENAIEQIEELFGTARDASWRQFHRLLERYSQAEAATPARSPSAAATPSGPLLRFDHDWVDETGHRVPLVLLPFEDRERPYGAVEVPLVVRAQKPQDAAFEIEVEIASPLHENWPDGWEHPTPKSMRVRPEKWRQHGDEVVFAFALTVPLRRPKTGKETVDITIRALNAQNGWPVSEKKRLRWKGVSLWAGEIPFSWPDSIAPELSHPTDPASHQEELGQLLLQVSDGRLSTTLEARQRLAEVADNPHILRVVSDRLIHHVNRTRRSWIAFDDVVAVENELRAALESGDEPGLSEHMRGPLNRAEDGAEWQPHPCYPVALALAASVGDDDDRVRLDVALTTLQRWCQAASESNGQTLVFTRERLDEHLADLAQLGLYRDDRIETALFRAWLAGEAESFPRDEDDLRALSQAALVQVREPKDSGEDDEEYAS